MKSLVTTLICLSLLVYGKTKESTNKMNLEGEIEIVNDSLSIDLNATCKCLFYKVIQQGLSPGIEINKDGFFHVSFSKYFADLNDLKIFSETFLEAEKKRMKPCIEKLNSLKLKEKDISEPFWEPQECFCDYNFWVNAQEYPQYFDLQNSTINNGNAMTEIRFFDINEKEKMYWDVYLKLQLEKNKDSKWIITSINKIL